MKALYRLSDASNPDKIKFSFATKENCLGNFLHHFSKDDTIVFANNIGEHTTKLVKNLPNVKYCSASGDASSFRLLLEYALNLPDEEIVYFIEDDYLHRTGAKQALHEGIDIVDYVSLYDHIDKYMAPSIGGNPLISQEGFDDTSVFLTPHSHWKLANSTTFCFAAKVKTIKEDADVFYNFTNGQNCEDFPAFRELIGRGRRIATPIPGFSTHCEIQWASPLIDWESLLNDS